MDKFWRFLVLLIYYKIIFNVKKLLIVWLFVIKSKNILQDKFQAEFLCLDFNLAILL